MKTFLFLLLSGILLFSPLQLIFALSPMAQAHMDKLRLEYAQGNRWETYSEAHLNEYVLPLTSLGETETAWLATLQPIACEITAIATSPLDAAMLLNRHLWKRIGVIYSTKREKANQDPLHSMRLGLASCSGLSILLVDACRSVGIPARVVGCVWKEKPGNHSWVEVWSGGVWHPLGAFEDVPSDQLWFLADAAKAVEKDPKYAIYAACATSGDTIFYGWNVPAVNVTARYTRKDTSMATDFHVYFAVERRGERVAVPFTVNGVQYTTPGPLQDLNDYAVIVLPQQMPFEVCLLGKTYHYDCASGTIIVEKLP